MSLAFVNRIIKGLFKIIGNIKIKKSKTMPDNQQPTPPVQPVQPTVLGEKTVVQFTLKGFIGTILTILGLFVSFYFMVFIPRAEKVEVYQKELMMQQEAKMKLLLIPVNDGIQANNESIKALGLRFNDLDDAVDDLGNTSGGFGGNRSTASATDPAVDPNLSENHQ